MYFFKYCVLRWLSFLCVCVCVYVCAVSRIAVFSISVLHDERIVVVAEQRPDSTEEDSFQWMSRVLQVRHAHTCLSHVQNILDAVLSKTICVQTASLSLSLHSRSVHIQSHVVMSCFYSDVVSELWAQYGDCGFAVKTVCSFIVLLKT